MANRVFNVRHSSLLLFTIQQSIKWTLNRNKMPENFVGTRLKIRANRSAANMFIFLSKAKDNAWEDEILKYNRFYAVFAELSCPGRSPKPT